MTCKYCEQPIPAGKAVLVHLDVMCVSCAEDKRDILAWMRRALIWAQNQQKREIN